VLDNHPLFLVAGALMALCVIGLRAVFNERLGITGGYTEVVERLSRRSLAFGWKAWFLLGILGGSALFILLAGTAERADGYGWLTRTFTGAGQVFVALLLLVAGVLIGFGAKTAGGCTSGNGLSGSSLGSPASLAATGTFMATAIAASFVIKGLM
jgi:uncharacterized membrane protein YedE/YeeE